MLRMIGIGLEKEPFALELQKRLSGQAVGRTAVRALSPVASARNSYWSFQLELSGEASDETNLLILSNVLDYSGTDDPAIDEDCRRIKEILRGHLKQQGKLPEEIRYKGKFS